MSVYHLHARLIEGSLARPERNELQSAETDDRQEIMMLAAQLVTRGFTVWIYEHGAAPRLLAASDFTVVAHFQPRARTRSRAGRVRMDASSPSTAPANPDVLPWEATRRPPRSGSQTP